ncbi:MAG TPA: hypothetical protein VF590_16605 [Isosphaeraceae bacterium]|jgi:hypothetical protein
MDFIENRTFDEIRVGDSASLVRTRTREGIRLFGAMSGAINPRTSMRIHANSIRTRGGRDAAWLGVTLDDEANRRNQGCISPPGRVSLDLGHRG